MRLLILNTCGAEGSFALFDTSSAEPPHLVTTPGRSASELLVKRLRETLTDLDWRAADLHAIAVVTGPGSFTGVRIGLSVAKGLSEAASLPLIAISRLELLKTAARPQTSTICALLDAGRGDFYCGRYQTGEAQGEALLTKVEALAAAGQCDETIICEDAVEAALSASTTTTRVPEPTAVDALPLALWRIERRDFADSATLDANYLRRTDAEIFAPPPRKAQSAG